MLDVLVLAGSFALVLLGVLIFESGRRQGIADCRRSHTDFSEAARVRRRTARAEISRRHLGELAARAEPLIAQGLTCRQIASRLRVDQGLLRRAVPTLPRVE